MPKQDLVKRVLVVICVFAYSFGINCGGGLAECDESALLAALSSQSLFTNHKGMTLNYQFTLKAGFVSSSGSVKLADDLAVIDVTIVDESGRDLGVSPKTTRKKYITDGSTTIIYTPDYLDAYICREPIDVLPPFRVCPGFGWTDVASFPASEWLPGGHAAPRSIGYVCEVLQDDEVAVGRRISDGSKLEIVFSLKEALPLRYSTQTSDGMPGAIYGDFVWGTIDGVRFLESSQELLRPESGSVCRRQLMISNFSAVKTTGGTPTLENEMSAIPIGVRLVEQSRGRKTLAEGFVGGENGKMTNALLHLSKTLKRYRIENDRK